MGGFRIFFRDGQYIWGARNIGKHHNHVKIWDNFCTNDILLSLVYFKSNRGVVSRQHMA